MLNPLKLHPSKSIPGTYVTASHGDYVPWVNEMHAPDQKQRWGLLLDAFEDLSLRLLKAVYEHWWEKQLPYQSIWMVWETADFLVKAIYDVNVGGFLYYKVTQ